MGVQHEAFWKSDQQVLANGFDALDRVASLRPVAGQALRLETYDRLAFE